MSTPPPCVALDENAMHMQPPNKRSENGGHFGNSEYNYKDKAQRSRSRSKDYGRDKDKEKYRDKDKDKDRKKRNHSRERERSRHSDNRERESKDRDRHRDKQDRDNQVGRDRDRRKRDRDTDRPSEKRAERDRDHDSRSRKSRSRNHEDYDRHKKHRSRSRSSRRRDRERDRERSKSGSYERHGRDRERNHERSRSRDRKSRDDRVFRIRDGERERSTSFERERARMELEAMQPKMEPIKEESRESRFDLSQTIIQELMSNNVATRNFAAFFNSTNSNDSISNGPSENSQDGTEARKRRKKSRWGGTENDKTFIPGMPTILPSTLDPTQQEAYLVQLQIEEISRKLRTGDLGISQTLEERSPSPEPIYSSDGKRLNTREFRMRKRLEEQRHQLIQKMQSVNPEFKPPADYKPPVTRVSDKVLIPQEQHPDINFVGLLIGPRGNTLKAMEKETGAKIIIRGKGSVKEGKVGRKDGQPLPGEDEPLHAFITAPNPEAVKKAVDKIKDVIRQGIEVPEGHNDLRRMQLRELAQLNGTLRETDCPRCTNCGSTEHKSWLCPDKPNVTNSIVCTSCGGAGHISKDCRSKRPGAAPTEDSQAKIDEEYMSLMAELGEGPPPPVQPKTNVDPLAQVHINRGYSLFDKKPSQQQAIQQAPPPPTHSSMTSMAAGAPPPPIPPAWNATPPSMAMPMPPMMPPPPSSQPPPPAPPASMMPWMAASQPPPPGGESMNPPIPGAPLPPPPPPGTGSIQPPGTGPMPPMIPPPPGTAAPLPPWPPTPSMVASSYGWGGGYAPPPPPGVAPPPPPCAPPPPGLPCIAQPPPPPPPN